MLDDLGPVRVLAPNNSYMLSYSVPDRYKISLADKIKEWDTRIEEDKVRYAQDNNGSAFTDEYVQQLGEVENALFSNTGGGFYVMTTKHK